jgi:hypothetical protein
MHATKAGMQLSQQRQELHRRAPTPGFIHPVSFIRFTPRSHPPGLLTRALVGGVYNEKCKGDQGNRARAPFSEDTPIISRARSGPVYRVGW